MDLPDFLKPNSKVVAPGVDPLAMPHAHRRGKTNPILLVLAIIAMLAFFAVGIWGFIRPKNDAQAQEATPTEYGDTGTLPAPLLQVSTGTLGPTVEATRTLITGSGLLTQFAGSQTVTASPTACTGDHFLTQLVCDDLAMTATLQAAQPGEVINVSGIDPKVTTIYVYPSQTPAPIIITATLSPTPVVITATPAATQTPWIINNVVTATPGPTQTPWFYITQPPVVTVMWTQLVTVQVPVTVVVTATPTNTPVPSETPTPTETPTP